MINAPCATLITLITPNPNASPLAIKAYTPPVSRPRMQAWMKTCTCCDGPALVAPGRLGRERLGEREALREHRQELSTHPLDEEVVAVGSSVGVPGQVALDRRPRAPVERGDDLLVVDRADLLHRQLQELADGPRLGGVVVDLELVPAVALDVLRDEDLVAVRRFGRCPVAAAEDPVHVLRPDLARELGRGVRAVREEQELRVVLRLDQRL